MLRTLRTLIPVSAIALAVAVAPASAAAPETHPTKSGKSTLVAADKDFAVEAGRGGVAEVQIAKVVVARATRKEVRDFAQRLVDDHSKANQELENLAGQKSLTLPTTLDASQQDLLDKMKILSGSAIDDTYLQEMIKDHEADAQLFQKGEQSQDPDLRAFAQRTLPVIEQHLEMAKRLAEVKSGNGAAR